MSNRDSKGRDEVRHELNAIFAVNFGGYLSIKDIRHDALKPAWYAFQSNIESIRTMAGLPQSVVNAAIEHLLPLVQATYNVLGKPVPDDCDLEPNKLAIREEYSKIVNGFLDKRRMVRDNL